MVSGARKRYTDLARPRAVLFALGYDARDLLLLRHSGQVLGSGSSRSARTSRNRSRSGSTAMSISSRPRPRGGIGFSELSNGFAV